MGFYSNIKIGQFGAVLIFYLLLFIGGTSICYPISETISETNNSESQYFLDTISGVESIVAVSPPTTKNIHQEFCALDRPTLNSVQINESTIIWYDSASNGNLLAPNIPLKDKTTYFAAQKVAGEESEQRLAISILLIAPSTPSTPNNVQVFSANDNPTVGDLGVIETNIVWYDAIVDGRPLDFDAPLQNGLHYYAARVFANCESIHRLEVQVEVLRQSDLKVSKTVNNKHPMIGEKVVLTITVENDGLSNFKDIAIKEYMDRGFNYVNAKTTNGSYNPSNQVWTLSSLAAKTSAVLNLEVEATPNGNYSSTSAIETSLPLDDNSLNNRAEIVLVPSCIKIYNEFTPNDDGDNDYFRIDCIETFPKSELQIFNRYGAIVYQKKAYQNDWRGLANVNGVLGKGEPLPTGTYFYVLRTDGIGDNISGWLFLRKE